uniref:Major facilitator superfamily (MFS) profile domain-containing protein n=1 Tax=Acrobeloides nanus TaxID=290746 RepID=A0A914BXH7_9BILA
MTPSVSTVPTTQQTCGGAVQGDTLVVNDYGGPLTPAIDSLIVSWIPETERGLAVTIYTTGVQVAGFVGIPFTAAICASALKWPAVYYISALAAFVMLAVYLLTTTNSPSEVKWMCDEEKEYLQQALGESSPKERPKDIPWLSLLTCVPIMACYACQFAYAMGQTMLQFYIPIIFKEILFLPIQQNGLYCAVVNIVAIVFKIVWSILLHKLNQQSFSTITTCKISQTFCKSFIKAATRAFSIRYNS